MKTKFDVRELLHKRQAVARGDSPSIRTGGDLQCSVGFISAFNEGHKSLDFFYKGMAQWEQPLLKTQWPAIWMFTCTQPQLEFQSVQDIIVGLNAVEVYKYPHEAHGQTVSLFLAQLEFFNFDYIYDVCEQQMKKEGSL